MKSNYEILGLSENSSTELVNKKYDALCRQYKQKTEKGVSEEDAIYYDEVTSAYNCIMGYEDRSSYKVRSSKPSVRRISELIGAYFNQYFFVVVIFVVLILFGITVFYQINTAQKDDLKIQFVGAFSSSDVSKLQLEINDKFETIQSPALSFYTIYDKTKVNQSVLYSQQKFFLELSRGYIDVYLVDKDVYDAYVGLGVFYPFDEYIKSNNREADWNKLNLLKYTPKEDEQVVAGTYGLEIKNATFLNDISLEWLSENPDRTMILVIGNASRFIDNSLKFTEEVISTIPEDVLQ